MLEVVVVSSQLCQCRRLVLHERDDSVQIPSFTRSVHRPPVHEPGVPPDGLTRLQVWQDGLDNDDDLNLFIVFISFTCIYSISSCWFMVDGRANSVNQIFFPYLL